MVYTSCMSMERIGRQEAQESPEEVIAFDPEKAILGQLIEKKRQAVVETENLIAAREQRLSEYLKGGMADPVRVEKLKEGTRVLERTGKIRQSELLSLLKEFYGDAKGPTIH